MEFFHYFSSVAFVMLTADHFVGHDDDPDLDNRSRIATFVEQISRISSGVNKKSESILQIVWASRVPRAAL